MDEGEGREMVGKPVDFLEAGDVGRVVGYLLHEGGKAVFALWKRGSVSQRRRTVSEERRGGGQKRRGERRN